MRNRSTESKAPDELTSLLDRAADGDEVAANAAWAAAQVELRGMAAALVARERPSAELQATVVIQEAYLRLVPGDRGTPIRWDDRRHFFGAAWRTMRQFLVDHARHRHRRKRGGDRRRVGLDVAENELLHLDRVGDEAGALVEALDRLAELDPRQHEIVWRRFALGQSVDDVASALGISPTTVAADWRLASAWLRRELAESGGDA